MRRRWAIAALGILLFSMMALAAQPQPPGSEGELVALYNLIVSTLQFVGIMGGAVAILVVVVRAGRTLGSVEQKIEGLTSQLSSYIVRNDQEHGVMERRIGRVETRTARLEGPKSEGAREGAGG